MGIFSLFLTIFLVLCLFWFFEPLRDRSGHKWTYRNPACRTCSICGRVEHEYGWAGDPLYKRGWWEEMRPGAGEKCTTASAKEQGHE
jgi:hypothetical protein